MAGREKEKIDIGFAFSNFKRVKIFELCKEPKNFTELKELTKLSTGALAFHLNILTNPKLRLIKKEEVKNNGKYKKGKEITLTSDEARKKELWKKQIREDYGVVKKEITDDETTIKILEFIHKKKVIESFDLTTNFFTINTSDNLKIGALINSLVGIGYIGYTLTDKGKKILKKKY